MNRISGLTIKNRLTLGFLFLCICIAAFGVFSSQTAIKMVKSQAGKTSLNLAEQYISDIKNEIKRQSNRLRIVSSLTGLQDLDSPEGFSDGSLIKTITNLYSDQIFDRIQFVNRNGVCTADTNFAEEVGKDLSGEHWIAIAKENGLHQCEVERDQKQGDLYFQLSIRVDDANGDYAGVLHAHANLATLTHLIEKDDKIFNTTRLKLFNGHGELLYATGAFVPLKSYADSEIYSRISGDNGYFTDSIGGIQKIYAYASAYTPEHEERWTILLEINSDEVLGRAYSLRRLTYIVLVSLLALAFIISYTISRSISRPLRNFQTTLETAGPENLHVRTRLETNDEIGIVSKAYDALMDMVEERTLELSRREWLQTGQARLAAVIRGGEQLTPLCSGIIKEVCEYSGADIGAFFIYEEGMLRRAAEYNYLKDVSTPDSFHLNEGLIGQAAAEKMIKLVEQPPENYVFHGSDLGRTVPSTLIILPFIHGDYLKGVLELGYLEKPGGLTTDYLEEIAEIMAIAVSGLQSMEQERLLLKKTEEQKHELQTQQEELRVSNEELEEQTRSLRMSEAKLREQRIELEESNVELEEKNDLLEEKQRQVIAGRKILEQKAAELEQASRYKSEFLSNMSHELRTPLNSLLLLARELTENQQGNLTADQVESAEIIYKGGNDLLTLINQILDLSRIEAGRLELYIDNAYLGNSKKNLETAFGKMAAEKNISFDVEIEEAPESIKTDTMRFEQILKNLIGNAIKFTSSGGVRVVFSSSDRVSPGGLAVSVTDTGIGITEEQQKNIFEAFQQADGSTSRRYGGTGLGLSIVRELTSLLQGIIELSSKPGEGSTFTIHLPAEYAESGNTKVSSVEAMISSPDAEMLYAEKAAESSVIDDGIDDDIDSIGKDDKVILIIEDDPKFMKVVIRLCRNEGYKTLGAANGYKGISLAEKYQPDGIILDIQLPGMDGHGVLKKLKGSLRTMHIPVHVVSVELPTIDAFREGAIGFLNKPASKEQLLDVIDKISVLSSDRMRKLLVVEDDQVTRKHITNLLSGELIEITEAVSGSEALKMLAEQRYHCIVLDLGLPDMGGYELLKSFQENNGEFTLPPVIIYTGKDITKEEEIKLNEFSSSIIIKDVRSDSRLIDEVSLFLHKVIGSGLSTQKQTQTDIKNSGLIFEEGKILVVDDDMRTLFALSKILSSRGLETVKAESGIKALSVLEGDNDIDIILMDIMMPEMDGFETINRIKSNEKFSDIPIIALTAKAMKGDREKCLEAGANDYLTKPVDSEKLLSLIKVWLYRHD